MKRQLFSIFILLLLGLSISAQTTDKTVEKIRAYYTEIAEKARLVQMDAEKSEFGELVMNDLTINSGGHQWRAVGIYNLNYKFFYKGGNSEKNIYPDQLVFVKVDKKISDRSYHEEFLYSDAGALMFYYQKAENDDQTPATRLLCFSGLKPIRITEDGKSRDRLTVKDAATVKEITEQSRKIKEIFIKSIKL